MGAFETFVNSNLGIRKPLITDSGPPSGSAKAAGIIGTEYINSDTNDLYEKTGENNTQDWVLIRKLGESLTGLSPAETGLENLESFTASFCIPSGCESLNISYSELGSAYSYPVPPKIFTSIRFSGAPDFIYSHVLYDVDTGSFNVQFSDEISTSSCFLDLFIASASGIQNPAGYTGGEITNDNEYLYVQTDYGWSRVPLVSCSCSPPA